MNASYSSWKLKLTTLFDQSKKIAFTAQCNYCKFSKGVFIGPFARLAFVEIDMYSYVSRDCSAVFTDIGKFSSVGANTRLGQGIHPTSLISTSPFLYSDRPPISGLSFASQPMFTEHLNIDTSTRIKIGNDVLIGANVTIADGVTIGDGAIIGYGSYVKNNVKPFEVVAGIPSRHIKFRFEEKIITQLMHYQWWNLHHKHIKELSKRFKSMPECLHYLEEIS